MLKSMEFFNRGEKTAKISFLAVALLGAMKGIVGYASASVSLLAQAIDSLMDLFALIAVFFGMRLSKRSPSERFPYGYYRAETFASLLVSILVMLTGGEVLRESALRILHPEQIFSPLMAISVATVSIPILYFLYRYVRRVGREINSQSLQGQAEDFKADVYSSFLVLIGVTASQLGYPWIEGVIGAVISFFILKAGLKQGWEALLVLMDAVVNPERMEKVKELAQEVKGVISVNRVRMRQSGPFCFGVLTIAVNKRIPVEQAYQLTLEIEQRVKQTFPFVESLVIHMEPQEESKFRVAIPIIEDRGMESTVTSHFGEAPFFLFVDVEQAMIQRWITKQNPGRELEKKRGLTIAHLIVEEHATALLTRELGEGPFHYLRNSFVDLYELSEVGAASNAMKAFLAGKLKKLKPRSNSKGTLIEV
jgi:cation diffusion facilitator family transporter